MIAPRPYALLAEITYRCPLHCPYCSNPTQTRSDQELTTNEWTRVIREAAALGVLQIGFSGGEPLARRDLPDLVRAAREANLYTNLITSGIGLDDDRVRALRDAGLDSVQLSFQSDNTDLADEIAGARAQQRKLDAAAKIRAAGIPLSLNFVIHRRNIDRLAEMIALAESLQAERVELANVQFYGWAFLNRAALLPTREQVIRAREIATAAKARLTGKIDIFYVLPDYYENRPKPCLNGWGQRYLTVNPVPWHRMDAGAMSELSAKRNRFWWMPLSGCIAHRKRREHRPGLRSVPKSRACRRRVTQARFVRLRSA